MATVVVKKSTFYSFCTILFYFYFPLLLYLPFVTVGFLLHYDWLHVSLISFVRVLLSPLKDVCVSVLCCAHLCHMWITSSVFTALLFIYGSFCYTFSRITCSPCSCLMFVLNLGFNIETKLQCFNLFIHTLQWWE